MTCVAVPDPLLTGDPRYRRADLVLPSLTELTARPSLAYAVISLARLRLTT